MLYGRESHGNDIAGMLADLGISEQTFRSVAPEEVFVREENLPGGGHALDREPSSVTGRTTGLKIEILLRSLGGLLIRGERVRLRHKTDMAAQV